MARHIYATVFVIFLTQSLSAAEWFVNPETANDQATGSKAAPFATIQKAVDLASDGDVIHLQPKNAVYRQSVLFRGRSNLTIEGNNVTLDGADALTEEGWEKVQPDLFRKRMPRTRWDRHLLIVQGTMQRMGRTQSSNSPDFPPIEKLSPGEFRFDNIDDESGWLYVRGSLKGLEWATRTNGVATSGECRNLIFKNLNARNFLNDGFNVHGDARGLKFHRIVGYDCFDEGFSAHDTCECEIIGGRFYGNENGIADVNSAETAYRNCEFYGNVNTDVLLIGKAHRMTNCRIVNTTKAAALVAGPRTQGQPFDLSLDKVAISTKGKEGMARVRVNGGVLKITESVFSDTEFVPLGSKLTTEGLKVNDSLFHP